MSPTKATWVRGLEDKGSKNSKKKKDSTKKITFNHLCEIIFLYMEIEYNI